MARAWKSAFKRAVLRTLVRVGRKPLHLTAIGKKLLFPGERVEEITQHALTRGGLKRKGVEESLVRKIILKQLKIDKISFPVSVLNHQIEKDAPGVPHMSTEMKNAHFKRPEELAKLVEILNKNVEEHMQNQVMLRKRIGWKKFEKVLRTIREID